MRKLITLAAVLLLAANAHGITASQIRWGEDLNSNMASNTLKQWTVSIENRLGGSATAGTGTTYYVDSNVSIEGDGKSWANARDTLQEAVDLCTDNNGDVIYVAQGHSESIASAGALALDCAGITIIGCGTGDQRPTFTCGTAASADITVTADDVYVYNMIFQSGKADLATVILITADDCTFNACGFRDSTSGLGMITIGAADGDSDRFRIANSTFYQPGTTNDHSIEVLFDMVGGLIADNIFYGDYDEGAIAVPAGGNACLDLNIIDNLISNVQASGLGISINGTASTGIIAGNRIYVDTYANGIDPGSLMDGGGNLISIAADLAGITALPAPAIGTVTAGSAEDILKKLYYTSDGTGAYPATVANDSTLAKIMAKGATATASTFDNTTDSLEAIADAISALGVAGVGSYADEVVTHMDANSILADLQGMTEVGAYVVASMDANSTMGPIVADLAGMTELGSYVVTSMDANSTTAAIIADLAGISEIGDKVQADMDANSVLYWQPRTTAVSVDEVTADIMDVQGGPIMITSITGYVSAEIGGNATTCKLLVDRDDLATDTDFTTAVAIESDVVGTVYIFTAANPSVLTPLTPGSNGSASLMTGGWFCPEGMIEQFMSADPGGAASDHITWYITWVPLTTGVTCIAQ